MIRGFVGSRTGGGPGPLCNASPACYTLGVSLPHAFVPTAFTAYARTMAICDGSGLIIFPTEDGPELSACHGCSACRSAHTPVTPARRAAAFAAAFVTDNKAF